VDLVDPVEEKEAGNGLDGRSRHQKSKDIRPKDTSPRELGSKHPKIN
jgi:hypothetical protein